MSFAIAIKMFGGFLFVSGSCVLVGRIATKDFLDISRLDLAVINTNIYAISEEVKDDQEKTPIDLDEKNYVCKIDKQYYECQINVVKDVDPTKNYLDIKDLKTNKKNHTINNYSLQQKNVIYRITANESFGNLMSKDKKIEIIKNAEDNGKKYASLKFLFGLHADDSIHHNTKIDHLIVSTENQKFSIPAKSNLYCKPSPSKQERNHGKKAECEVYEFSDQTIKNNKLSDFAFKRFTKGAKVTMTANKYYLINLKRSLGMVWTKYLEIFPNNGNKTSASLTFVNSAIPAIYISDKPDQIFILDKL